MICSKILLNEIEGFKNTKYCEKNVNRRQILNFCRQMF
jgi:hypothetical protein